MATCPTTQPQDEDAWCPPCSEASPQRPLWDEDEKKCTACPEGLSWRRKPWLARPQCVQACPDAKPYESEDSTCHSCADVWPGEGLIFSPSAQTCVLTCPKELPLKRNGKCTSCTEADNDKPYWDPATETCTAACPEMVINGKCVLCTEADKFGARPHWDSQHEECRSCADAFPGEAEVWDPNTHKCVSKC